MADGHRLAPRLIENLSIYSTLYSIVSNGKNYLEKILGMYISHKLAMASANPLPRYPLLADKAGDSKILIYLCKNYACRQPVSTLQDFVTLLEAQ